MSHMHKSTKMGFPRNQPEMVQLHKNITSSKMVVRGWHTTLCDRRNLLISKKLVWGGFPNLPDLLGPICDFPRFFREFRPRTWIPKNRVLGQPSPKKMFENIFFSNSVTFFRLSIPNFMQNFLKKIQ